MQNDVAEALRRYRSGKYTEDENAVDQDVKDMRTLAAAYAASAAAGSDPGPLSVEWLAARGWERQPGPDGGKNGDFLACPGFEFLKWSPKKGTILGFVPATGVKTREDMKLLLRLLGRAVHRQSKANKNDRSDRDATA